jgi:hypothetical protein
MWEKVITSSSTGIHIYTPEHTRAGSSSLAVSPRVVASLGLPRFLDVLAAFCLQALGVFKRVLLFLEVALKHLDQLAVVVENSVSIQKQVLVHTLYKHNTTYHAQFKYIEK